MAKSQLTFKKKEQAKKKQLKKQDKLERRAQHKLNNDKGKSLEDMFMYVDEHGNLSERPPLVKFKATDEDLVRPTVDEDAFLYGKVSYYNETGHYGFIRDNVSRETVYFNDSLVGMRLHIDQKVQYRSIRGKKGNQASEVSVIA